MIGELHLCAYLCVSKKRKRNIGYVIILQPPKKKKIYTTNENLSTAQITIENHIVKIIQLYFGRYTMNFL